jgi:hypothetical protein
VSNDEEDERPTAVSTGGYFAGRGAAVGESISQKEGPAVVPGSGPPGERRAAGQAVRGAYGGFADALRAGAVLLAEIPRYALLQAEQIDAFANVCDLLSSDAQQEAIDYARRSSGFDDIEWTCVKAIALLLRSARVGGMEQQVFRTKLVAINVDGDQATATLSFGKEGSLSTAPLVKEKGEWKIGSSLARSDSQREVLQIRKEERNSG